MGKAIFEFIFGQLVENAVLGIDGFVYVALAVAGTAGIILFIAHKLWG